MKLFCLLLVSVVLASAQSTLVYCSFSSTVRPCAIGNPGIAAIVLDSNGIIGSALRLCFGGSCPTQTKLLFPPADLPMQRGTVAFWIKPNSQVETSFVDTYPPASAGPDIQFEFDAAKHQILLDSGTDFGNNRASYGSLPTDNITLATGLWYHIVYTWVGTQWTVYVNGALISSQLFNGPFPYSTEITQIRMAAPYQGDLSLDEFAIYDFLFSRAEVSAAYNSGAGQSSPLSPISPHGVSSIGQWSPGYSQVAYLADAGNDNLAAVTSFHIDAYENGTRIASTVDSSVVNGYVEGLLQLPVMSSGTYTITASAYGSNGLITSATSAPYVFIQPVWLHNSYGIDASVPAPWSEVTVFGDQLGVFGRTYDLTGSFGIPTQITSQGTNLLTASGITLSLVQSRAALTLGNKAVRVTSSAPNIASWSGSAVTTNGAGGNQVNVAVRGSLEYDGFEPLSITLSPASGSVSIDAIKIKVNVSPSVGQYTYLHKDAYVPFVPAYVIATPMTAGQYNTNLGSAPGSKQANYWLDVNLGNNNVSLHIEHENESGWNLNESVYWQRMLVESDGSVSYEFQIANHPITLAAPMTFSFTLMATPVKPLPPGWRLSGAGASVALPPGHLNSYFGFVFKSTWAVFFLSPVDLAAYKNGVVTPLRARNWLFTPFTNAHVFLNLIGVFNDVDPGVCVTESNNTRYYDSTPSRCTSDYWAYNMNRLLNDPTTPNVVDGYYVDESYDYTTGAALIQGGFKKATGNHGFGMRYYEQRYQMQRLDKLLQAAGKVGDVYMHTTAFINPVVNSHALMTLGGECCGNGATGYDDSTIFTGLDHFDHFNNNGSFLNPSTPGYGSNLVIADRQTKFGYISESLRGTGPGTWYDLRQQQAECILQLADVIQQDMYLDWWQIKKDWGLDALDVTFNPFWSQTAISSAHPATVETTYYSKTRGSSLAYIANFDRSPVADTISFNLESLGIHHLEVTQDVLDTTCDSVGCSGTNTTYHTATLPVLNVNQVNIAIPSHQCVILTASDIGNGGSGANAPVK